MNRRLDGDISLNVPIQGTTSVEGEDRLIDDHANQEARLAESEEGDRRRRALKQALTALNGREHRIFTARRLAEEPPSLEELAGEFGISGERVRQIEQRAFEKVQAAVKSHLAATEFSRYPANGSLAGASYELALCSKGS